MDTTTITPRDRAVLRAVAAGRCVYAAGTLLVDGICCCDQFIGPRLVRAGLISSQSGPARLTANGRAVLDAAYDAVAA
ncbi:hypothetical protein ALI22I_46110 [Saccharothrix sp. ALI-22-I]|uniref:hypothetical protein n=1 Tax=Saccharothrix sp. ALI-22-I TaxID=1933778 RepID=UPI00097BFCDD|nr:hypothetical protein [Saccharothrix sp. ALI-22-I]ONI80639.1 hypothetical protein ALI22I_46110 [Saccharothrix sp. ALI-22-I]